MGGKVIFWGATGQARMLQECLGHQGYEVVALVEGSPSVDSPFPGVPIYRGREGFEQWFAETPDAAEHSFVVAIGGPRGQDRILLHDYLASRGLKPISAVHPTAYVAQSAFFGEGAQILPRAIVCVNVIAGKSCIINTGASVDHECRLGDGVHLCPGVRLAGCVEIGDFATLYTGAIVIPRIKIGEGAVVGAGAVVIRDVPPHTVVVGNPARELKKLAVTFKNA
jgi:sugar O-acyltransferase (sialic acid O-acetyltransferase NeuD family)